MVDAADITDYFVDIVRIEIIAEEDGVISNLKVKICREGTKTFLSIIIHNFKLDHFVSQKLHVYVCFTTVTNRLAVLKYLLRLSL